MVLSKFMNEQFKIFVQNQKLTIALAVSMTANMILMLYIVIWATDARTFVLPPYNPTKEFWIAGDQVSASYMEQVGIYISELMYNVSPDNVKQVKPSLLPLVPTENWSEVERSLTTQLSYITQNAIVRIFHPSSVDWSKKGVLRVTGIIKEMSADIVTDTRKSTIRIDYMVKNGRFWLLGIREEKGI
jgi:conjugal transfer pilus assembly protein TraE